ncbi:MAG: TrkA family potassium uptake protein [Acidimicrobiales bacterium]
MHVVIVGCGRVGSTLAAELESAGHTVGVIDKRADAFARLPAEFSGRTIVGPGIDRDRLAEAGIGEAGALAAVTSGDNSNILVARIARETYEVPHVVARIYDPGRASIYQRLGIPTVATVTWTTDQALRRLLPDETRTAWTDPTGGVSIVERTVPVASVGRPLSELDAPGRWQITVITRGGEAALPVPSLIAQEGDILMIAVGAEHVADLEKRLDQNIGGRA